MTRWELFKKLIGLVYMTLFYRDISEVLALFIAPAAPKTPDFMPREGEQPHVMASITHDHITSRLVRGNRF
jgi:hypothetical protein